MTRHPAPDRSRVDDASTTRFARLKRHATRIAVGGAWLFALGTLIMLIAVIALQPTGSDGSWAIASTTVDGTTYEAIGLTYEGRAGTAIAWIEAVVLLGAIVCSVLPVVAIRRVGHGVLMLWAALWLANGVWLAALDEMWWFWPILIVPCGVFFLCTTLRAALGWRVAPA